MNGTAYCSGFLSNLLSNLGSWNNGNSCVLKLYGTGVLLPHPSICLKNCLQANSLAHASGVNLPSNPSLKPQKALQHSGRARTQKRNISSSFFLFTLIVCQVLQLRPMASISVCGEPSDRPVNIHEKATSLTIPVHSEPHRGQRNCPLTDHRISPRTLGPFSRGREKIKIYQ